MLVGSVDSSEAKMHIDPGKNGPNWSGPTPLGPVVRCLNSIVSLVVFFFSKGSLYGYILLYMLSIICNNMR